MPATTKHTKRSIFNRLILAVWGEKALLTLAYGKPYEFPELTADEIVNGARDFLTENMGIIYSVFDMRLDLSPRHIHVVRRILKPFGGYLAMRRQRINGQPAYVYKLEFVDADALKSPDAEFLDFAFALNKSATETRSIWEPALQQAMSALREIEKSLDEWGANNDRHN